MKDYGSILKYYYRRSLTKCLSICNSLLNADMDLLKCGRKSAYFFMEKQKCKKMDCVLNSPLDLKVQYTVTAIFITNAVAG